MINHHMRSQFQNFLFANRGLHTQGIYSYHSINQFDMWILGQIDRQFWSHKTICHCTIKGIFHLQRKGFSPHDSTSNIYTNLVYNSCLLSSQTTTQILLLSNQRFHKLIIHFNCSNVKKINIFCLLPSQEARQLNIHFFFWTVCHNPLQLIDDNITRI
jgi:hypothetical protein